MFDSHGTLNTMFWREQNKYETFIDQLFGSVGVGRPQGGRDLCSVFSGKLILAYKDLVFVLNDNIQRWNLLFHVMCLV